VDAERIDSRGVRCDRLSCLSRKLWNYIGSFIVWSKSLRLACWNYFFSSRFLPEQFNQNAQQLRPAGRRRERYPVARG
jgi:hypothetical protein